jgi:hypothetical protein
VETCQIQGWVESDREADDAQWFAPFTLWHRFPRWCQPFLSSDNGDPFLAALLVPARRTGKRLAISAPLSPRPLDALPDIQSIYACFDQRQHHCGRLMTRHSPPEGPDPSPRPGSRHPSSDAGSSRSAPCAGRPRWRLSWTSHEGAT